RGAAERRHREEHREQAARDGERRTVPHDAQIHTSLERMPGSHSRRVSSWTRCAIVLILLQSNVSPAERVPRSPRTLPVPLPEADGTKHTKAASRKIRLVLRSTRPDMEKMPDALRPSYDRIALATLVGRARDVQSRPAAGVSKEI